MDGAPKHDMVIVMGDWNENVGGRREGDNGIVGDHAVRGREKRQGERFVPFCATNNLAIASTMYPHKNIHKYTWKSLDGRYHNHIDHTAVNARFRRSINDIRVYRTFSDHNLMVAVTQLRLCRLGKKKALLMKYEVHKLEVPKMSHPFVNKIEEQIQLPGSAR